MATPKSDDSANRPVVRFLRRLAHMVRVFYMPDPSVPADQRAKMEDGFRTRGPNRSLGRLILTTDNRLVFERAIPWWSIGRLYPSPNFVVDLADIVEVQRLGGDVFDSAPLWPILSLTLAGGRQIFVQVLRIDDWLDALGEAIAINPVKRTPDASTQS